DLNNIWVEDGMEFELLGYHCKASETPGHTKGSMCYYCELGLFSGDTLFRLSVGRTDFPTGNEVELSKSLKRLCDSLPKNTKVYPGHQEETTLAYEMKRNHWLKK
ncbi:MAG: MBL fold metallo-hydrolase, partial [Anaeroplasmataceae bacterium]|nr:MBL fold metallo-hydrolase [Anaeroplasmataceae bacterium]